MTLEAPVQRRAYHARDFVEEFGGALYNRAVADVHERLQARVMEVEMKIHEDAFRSWHTPGRDRERR